MIRQCGKFFVLALAVVAGTSAKAQDIRYFVKQSTGLFEITSEATGGVFMVNPTGETIKVDGIGTLPVRGRTDRAARHETVVNQIRGRGKAAVAVTYQPQNGAKQTIFSGPIGLPFVLPRTVSPSTDVDNLVVSVTQNGKTTSRRLPIGTRPNGTQK
jgi:hypothetical protein